MIACLHWNKLKGWEYNLPMLNFRLFFDFSQICRIVKCMWTAIQLKNIVQYFFRRFVFHIRQITYANNCVFHCVHKEINNAFSPGANYLFRESGLQITLRLLSSSLGNTVLLYALFLEYETQIGREFNLLCREHTKGIQTSPLAGVQSQTQWMRMTNKTY